ncbi:phosphoglycerate mutase family protein [Actinoplanes aureus]|uniref:Histidine phosphatase family protein n=1 Tax=Actinoplanes aureus TaxID=2792083 RepID=A0A931C8X8_9ACTN|nr:phosphoglycerate mutase family protein [Actinoplanes aureus]MBG0565614.1 histidine phosphatase family protein [Actinoplanes aureus]
MSVRHLWIVRHAEATRDQSNLTEAGRRQADLLGARLAGLPITAISHSPKPRAVKTAALVAAHLPEAAVKEAAELNDRIPTDDLPAMSAMIARFTGPVPEETHELVVTHNFQAGWFVREAYLAPPERFGVLNFGNTGLTLIRYPAGEPPRVIMVGDLSHLPADLRWTGLPPDLRP